MANGANVVPAATSITMDVPDDLCAVFMDRLARPRSNETYYRSKPADRARANARGPDNFQIDVRCHSSTLVGTRARDE